MKILFVWVMDIFKIKEKCSCVLIVYFYKSGLLSTIVKKFFSKGSEIKLKQSIALPALLERFRLAIKDDFKKTTFIFT